jgi:hypothetical protein
VRDDVGPGAPGVGGTEPRLALARAVADRYAAHPEVEAVAIGGSVASGVATDASDIDLYVYLRAELPVAVRAAIAGADSTYTELANTFWEPGDEWYDAATGIAIDVILRDPAWIEEQLDRVLRRHEASIGYTTCLWANVRASLVLFDRNGWYGGLKDEAAAPYPEPLRRAIVAKNFPVLRDAMSGYRSQLAKAASRRDLVSLNHRVAAFLASCFDILFALNRVPHPGEKRLVELAEALCPVRPAAFASDVEALILASAGDGDVVATADRLTGGLERLLRADALL